MDRDAGMILESGERLSQSLIWKLQRAFYAGQGIDAWRKGAVPSRITTNSFVAETYARLIRSFLRDLGAQGKLAGVSEKRPVAIVELGAGHGRFGYLGVQRLLASRRREDLPPFVWIMTDFADRNVEFWRTHPTLATPAGAGHIDYALFDGEASQELRCVVSGRRLAPDSPAPVLIVVANYFFDSLPHDVFEVRDGKLRESLVAVELEQGPLTALDDPSLIDRIALRWVDGVERERPYEDDELNGILDRYRDTLGDTSFCFPIGAFKCLAALVKLTEGPLLVLSVDKGYVRTSQLLSKTPPSLVRHGSFSFMVNYDAISRWFARRGGFSLLTSERGGNLETAVFVEGGSRERFPETARTFDLGPERFAPVDFHVMKNGLNAQLDLLGALALIRLSGDDPDTFFDLRDAIRDQAAEADEDTQQDLCRTLARVRENIYPFEERDIPFAMARIFQRIGRYRTALEYYKDSLRFHGDDRATWYNMGLCQYRSDRQREALDHFSRALALDPSYGSAREWKLRVEAELAGA